MSTREAIALAVMVSITLILFWPLCLFRKQVVVASLIVALIGFMLWVDAYWLFQKTGVPTDDLPNPPGQKSNA